MQLSEAIQLIQHPIIKEKSSWADLGCSDGLFTNALSQLLPDDSIIYAVDKNKRSLKRVEVRANIKLEKVALNFVVDELPFNNISGILMANAFHFVKDKDRFIQKVFACLNNKGYVIIIEYDTDKHNFWVPYPTSFNNLKKFFEAYHYTTEKLHQTPSRYNGTIYSAIIKKA